MFLSPQVKRITISYKHGIYELPHKLPNDLRLTLGNQEISRSQNFTELYIAWCSVSLPKLKFCQYQQKILQKLKLNFSLRVLFHRKTTVCLKHFGQDCSFSMTGDMNFQTSHFADFEQLKVDVHFANFGQVRIDSICSLLLTLDSSVISLSLGKTCPKKQSNKNSRTMHRILHKIVSMI